MQNLVVFFNNKPFVVAIQFNQSEEVTIVELIIAKAIFKILKLNILLLIL